jgi:lipoprotein-anchoring transpeptidase ErfK/SrfK
LLLGSAFLAIIGAGTAAAIGALGEAPSSSSSPREAASADATRVFLQAAEPLAGETGKYEVKSLLNVRRPLRYGEFVWNETSVHDGPRWIRVDLKRQVISIFRDGHEIGTAVILYGAPEKRTPVGSFPILEKREEYHSRTYDAPMPFMLRLTADGVAVHGSDVRRGKATNGCIGVPLEFAKRLYTRAMNGDIVSVS